MTNEWTAGIEHWRLHGRRLTDNPVEVVDVSERDVARLPTVAVRRKNGLPWLSP